MIFYILHQVLIFLIYSTSTIFYVGYYKNEKQRLQLADI